MSFYTNYQPLFELHLLHNYFLGLGDESYDHTQLPTVFNTYNFQDFARVVPTQKTAKVLKSHKMLIQTTTTGITCLVAADESSKPFINSTNEELEFLVYIKDALFEKYTNINTENKSIYHFTSDASSDKTIDDLSKTNASSISNFAIAFSTDENSDYQKLLQEITVKERVALFGIVKISMNDLLETNGEIPTNAISYKIVFDSRTAVWVYLDSQDNEVYRTDQAFPFTKKGTIKIIDEQANVYRMASPSDALQANEAIIYV